MSRAVTTRKAAAWAKNTAWSGYLDKELKFYDTSVINGAIVNSVDASGGVLDPTELCLNAPSQGDGPSNRDGRKIVMKSIQINGVLQMASNATQLDFLGTTMVALVLDTQTNGAQCQSDDVFLNSTGAIAGSVTALRELLHGKRFRVLKKWILEPRTPASGYDGTNPGVGGSSQHFGCYLKVDIPVMFGSGTTSTVNNIVDNSLHMIAFSDTSAATETLNYQARIRFLG